MAKELSIAELAAMAGEYEDQTETVASFDFEPPAAGVTVGRLISYIELGKQPVPDYMGKPKPPADKVRLTFELLAPKNIKEYEVEGGDKRTRAEQITLTLSKKLGDKAAYKKLFNKMLYGRANIKHMAQMLGEAFILTIHHNVVEKDGGKKLTYANLNAKGADYDVGAPFKVDALEGTSTPLNVPAALSPLKLFLFDRPTKATWDSLFIEGTREVTKDGGEKEQVSKNWLQETILSAKNFEGSALQQMLGGVAELPQTEAETGTVDEIPAETVETKTVAKAAAKPAGKPKASAATVVAAKAGGANDALAALGLS